MNPSNGRKLDVGISGQEPPGNAKKSDGFFEKGILRAMESQHVSNRNAPEVKVVGNGHCHGMYHVLPDSVSNLTIHFRSHGELPTR